jgi:hypothetical protein
MVVEIVVGLDGWVSGLVGGCWKKMIKLMFKVFLFFSIILRKKKCYERGLFLK